MALSFLHPAKQLSPIWVNVVGKLILTRLIQSNNAYSPIVSRVVGRTNELNIVQPLNAELLMFLIPLPNSTFLILSHSKKAFSWTSLVLDVSITDVKVLGSLLLFSDADVAPNI